MGDAKRRGSLDERIAQAQSQRVPPKPGLYLSTKEVMGMRLIVEDVTIVEDDDAAGFFLVSMIDEASADDMAAAGDELDPDQWFELVDQYGLVHSEE